MSRAACFRCDWEGETRAASCPNCGAPLYRAADPRTARPHEPPEVADLPEPEPTARVVAPPGQGVWRSLFALATVTGLLATLWTQIPRGSSATHRPVSSATPLPAPRGSLVYAAAGPGSAGQQTLWSIDLATGIVLAGPRVPRVTELVDASLAGQGWVGLSARRPDGTTRAYVLRGTSPRDRPTSVGSGDLVAWGPRGQSIVVARVGLPRNGCHRSVTIRTIQVETGSGISAFAEPGLCGDLLSVGRDGQLTYFTRERRGQIGIYYVGIHVAHSVLRGYGMLSVSPASDFLVTQITRPGRAGPSRGRPTIGGTALYWRGDGGPVAFGTARKDLFVDRALAWSGDASEAVVAGWLGSRPGVYMIDAGAGPTRRSPRLILPSGRRMGVTFSADGTAYLVIDGHLFAYVGRTRTEVPLPDGAPPPAGPITWIP